MPVASKLENLFVRIWYSILSLLYLQCLCPCLPIGIFGLHLIDSVYCVCVCLLFDKPNSLIHVKFILDSIFPLVKWIKKVNWKRHYAFQFKSFIIENPDRQSEIKITDTYFIPSAYNVLYTFIHLSICFFFSVRFHSFRNRRTSLYDYSIPNPLEQFYTISPKVFSLWFPFNNITANHQLPIR